MRTIKLATLSPRFAQTGLTVFPSSYAFKVDRAAVSFGELVVTVDPEIGMRTATEDRAFKLWLPSKEVDSLLDVCSYLLWEAAERARWPRIWRPGIWDVCLSRLVDAHRPFDQMEEWLHQCASEFVALSAPA